MDEDTRELERLRRRVELLEAQLGRRRDAIHHRDEFLRRAFEDAPIGMALVDLDERIVEANAALCRMLGYAREQLLQKTVPDITHPDDLALEAKPRGDMRDGEALTYEIEKRYVRGDGSVMIGLLSVSALYDEHARPAYFIGQLQDVTREREAELTLREREAMFRALIDNSSEIFCVIDSAGVLAFVSSNVDEQLGWSAQEIVGRALAELLHDDDRDEFQASLAAVLADPSAALRVSSRVRHHDGRVRDYEIVGHNRLDVDVLAGVVVTLRDVSEQRALQAQLSQASRLDSLGRLAGGVAHDFNNMLSVILAMTEFLGESFAPDDPRREDLDAIEQTAMRARDLTGQLLAIGRRQHGAVVAVDVHAQLRAEQRFLGKVLGEDVDFGLELAAESGHVMIDPGHFEQVVLNLASNARDAMPAGGRFTLRTRTRALVEARPPLAPGRYLELEAEDTGEGMDAQTREHIFDPFFTTKEVGEGTGLGLATVYGIVRQAGGDISVQSEPGRGTRFSIVWPEAAAAAAAAASAAEPSGPAQATGELRGCSVLLVEDEYAVREVVTRILRGGGYVVTDVGDPAEALALARGGLEIDLVVSDVVMPDMTGPEMVARLIEQRGPVPVVYVSGYAKAAQSELRDHPGFLTKPFTPAALLAKVESQLLEFRAETPDLQ